MKSQKGISFHNWRSGITVVVRKARKPLLSSGEPLQLNGCPYFHPSLLFLTQFFFLLLPFRLPSLPVSPSPCVFTR